MKNHRGRGKGVRAATRTVRNGAKISLFLALLFFPIAKHARFTWRVDTYNTTTYHIFAW